MKTTATFVTGSARGRWCADVYARTSRPRDPSHARAAGDHRMMGDEMTCVV